MFKKKKIIKLIFTLKIILGSIFISTLFASEKASNSTFIEAPMSYNQEIARQSTESSNEGISSEEPSVENIDFSQEIALPNDISFVFSEINNLIPEDPKRFPGNFQSFYKKLLNDASWINLGAKVQDFIKALREIYYWYLETFTTPHYVGAFPSEAKQLITSILEEHKGNNLFSQFQKINSIPENSEELRQGTKFKYIFPKVLKVLDENYPNARTIFPNLNKFDYKMISINTDLLDNDFESFLNLQYSYNNGYKYNIYIRNKNNQLANEDNTIEDLIKKGCIIIRRNDKKYKTGDTPIDLEALNISIAKVNNRIEFFTSIKSLTDYATLTINNNLKDNWKDIAKIGLLDYPISPKNAPNAIRGGESYNMIPDDAFNNLQGYSDKADHIIKPNGLINGKPLKTFNIKFYMAVSEKITIPIFYRNEQIDGSSNIILEIDLEGALIVNRNTLRIPSDDYREKIEPIEIKHRKGITETQKIWVEVEIITDSNVIVGNKDVMSTLDDVVPAEFKLKYYGAVQRDIIFEKPLEFLEDYEHTYIKYARIFDSEKVTKKMIGELYYSAWGVYEPKFSVMGIAGDITISSLIMPTFQNKKLSYFTASEKIFLHGEKPNNNKIVQNNFGKLIQDINNYYNRLNNIIKAITDYDISLLKGQDFLKSTKEIQEQKFVTNRLMGKNINDAMREVFRELKIATNAFVNGSELLLEKSKAILGIMDVNKNDRDSWAKFALPRIIIIIKQRYSSVFSKFENALSKYKYDKIVIKLLEANSSNYEGKFIGISSKIITNKVMQIGSKKQNMNILKNIQDPSRNFNNFRKQLESILNFIKQKPALIKRILNEKDSKLFIKNSDLLIKNDEIFSNNKEEVLVQAELLFKILDFYIRDQIYPLQSILTINNFIKDDKERIKVLVDNFNNAITNFLKSRKVHVSAYAFKDLVEDKFIETAQGNIEKIFDSFLNKSNLGSKEIEAISYYKNFDYIKKPNKLFEIAVKIGEFNFERFLKDITKNDIQGVANKILKLDPLKELPSNLPTKSKFTDVIKGMSNEPKIIYTILGAITSLSGVVIALIGFINRSIMGSKARVIISVGLITIGVLTLSIIFAFPSIGNLSLIAN